MTIAAIVKMLGPLPEPQRFLVAPIAGAPGPGVVAADAERNAPRWLLIAAAETRAYGRPVWVATPIEPGQGR